MGFFRQLKMGKGKWGLRQGQKGLFALALLLGFSQVGSAVTLAIIDSGTDLKHKDLAPLAWINAKEIAGNGIDEDNNGRIDDVHGWNYTGNNGEVIDYKFLGTFPPEIHQFFHIQSKMYDGSLTSEELIWIKAKAAEKDFRNQLSTYSNFVHGTHVAGIAARESHNNKILSLKIIPTEVSGGEDEDESEGGSEEERERDRELAEMVEGQGREYRLHIMKTLFKKFTTQQSARMEDMARYLDGHKTDVANGSFGTGFRQVSSIVKIYFKPLFSREATPEEIKTHTVQFLQELLKGQEKSFKAATNTLFVFAAGNDGSDNDILPESPANTEGDHILSVAATFGRSKLAKFSNYGKTQVDVAAPGVNISSTVPGNQYLMVSGTSQAAPYVAGIAGEMKHVNPKLKPAEMKKILMGTVDPKDFLKGKVVSGGIVNRARALKAATYFGQGKTLTESLRLARREVADIVPGSSEDKSLEGEREGEAHPLADELVLPLPGQFTIPSL